MIGPVVRLCVPKLADTFSVKANLTLLTNNDAFVRSRVSDEGEELDGNVLFDFYEHQNIGDCLRGLF
jgi:hypothetical protein